MPDENIHPYWQAHFFEPLFQLQATCESIGVKPAPEDRLSTAKIFAEKLRDCPDAKALPALVSEHKDGAARFLTIGGRAGVLLARQNPAPNRMITPVAGKPFAGIANHILLTLGMLENINPQAMRPDSGPR